MISPSFKAGEFDSHGVDAPFLFRHAGRFYMTYIGWDSIGYRTGLAVSDDLVHWEKLGVILDRGPTGSVTEFNIALTSILCDNDLRGSGELKKIDGRFVGTYHAYPASGYEAGPAVIGLCYSDDLRSWHVDPPSLRAEDGDAWERGGLYKSWLMEHAGIYYLFYNAKDVADWPWKEQIGFATSNNLIDWKRSLGNPVLKVGPAGAFDDLFASDPCVLRDGAMWTMFYFGNSTDGHARESVAFSDDLKSWTKSGEILVDVGGAGAIDSQFAHKPGIIFANGKLHHFCCAVRKTANGEQFGDVKVDEVRGITSSVSR